jgi:hypothetical protein
MLHALSQWVEEGLSGAVALGTFCKTLSGRDDTITRVQASGQCGYVGMADACLVGAKTDQKMPNLHAGNMQG